MKRIFSLVALTIMAAISLSASAQSFVGKWDSSAGSQAAMLEAVGATIDTATTTMVFNADQTYDTYLYVKAGLNIEGISMTLLMEGNDRGTWSHSNNKLTMVSSGIELKNFDIEFGDPSLNAMKGYILESMRSAMNEGRGEAIEYETNFVNNNEVQLKYHIEYMPIEFTLVRIE